MDHTGTIVTEEDRLHFIITNQLLELFWWLFRLRFWFPCENDTEYFTNLSGNSTWFRYGAGSL